MFGSTEPWYAASEHGIQTSIEDLQLEESLSAAASIAKTDGSSSADKLTEQVDVAARLLTSVAALGKQVGKLAGLLESNPQVNGSFDVDGHLSFASAVSKLQTQLRPQSMLSLSLHKLLDVPGEPNAYIIDEASFKVVSALVGVVTTQMDFSLMQVPFYVNDFIHSGGDLGKLAKSNSKIQQALQLFRTEPGTGDQDYIGIRENVKWLIRLRPLHIAKLLSKVPGHLGSHSITSSSWKSVIDRFQTASACIENKGVLNQLFAFDSLQENDESCALMWCKFLMRSEELTGRQFTPRTKVEWEAVEASQRAELGKKTVPTLKTEIRAFSDASNVNLLTKSQCITLIMQEKMERLKDSEEELRKKWQAVADSVLNEGKLFMTPAAAEENLQLQVISLKNADESAQKYRRIVSEVVSRQDAILFAVNEITREVQQALAYAHLGMTPVRPSSGGELSIKDVGTDFIVEKYVESSEKKKASYHLDAVSSHIICEEQLTVDRSKFDCVQLYFYGDIVISPCSEGKQIKGTKIRIGTLQLLKDIRYYIFVTPPGSNSLWSCRGMNYSRVLAWELKAATDKHPANMKFNAPEAPTLTMTFQKGQLLEHEEMCDDINAELSLPYLSLDRMAVETALTQKERPYEATAAASKRRKKDPTSEPKEIPLDVRLFPVLFRPCLQCEINKAAANELKKAARDQKTKDESQTSGQTTEETQTVEVQPADDEDADEAALIYHLMR